uniref:Transcriptional regulator n=1 Tax=Steinernema glaseri TaxID=37863 RepID=A0A1I7Y340_9BILA
MKKIMKKIMKKKLEILAIQKDIDRMVARTAMILEQVDMYNTRYELLCRENEALRLRIFRILAERAAAKQAKKSAPADKASPSDTDKKPKADDV